MHPNKNVIQIYWPGKIQDTWKHRFKNENNQSSQRVEKQVMLYFPLIPVPWVFSSLLTY